MQEGKHGYWNIPSYGEEMCDVPLLGDSGSAGYLHEGQTNLCDLSCGKLPLPGARRPDIACHRPLRSLGIVGEARVGEGILISS